MNFINIKSSTKFPSFLLILFIISVLGTSCSSIGIDRKLASGPSDETSKPRHLIFLVHGIAGSAKSFGHMDEALTRHLNASKIDNVSYDNIVKSFVYDTFNNQKNTEQFAKDLGRAIDQFFSENGEIRPQDKISLVAHSQGGIVSLIWLYNATLGNADFHPKYVSHVDSYITLGTPFWGAKIALFAENLKKATVKGHDDSAPLFGGDRQLEDMSFGSQVINNFRTNATRPEFQEALRKMNLHVRPVNFGGAASSMKMLAPFAIGKKEYEDDTAVPLPSSRLDFIYASSLKSDYEDGEVLQSTDFHETHYSPFHVVDALHLTYMRMVKKWSAVADIPSECIKNANCDHPTFKYVLAHLKHDTNVPNEKLLSKMSGYLLDINLRLPVGDTLSAEDVNFEFTSNDKDLSIADPMEILNHGHTEGFSPAEDENYRRYFFTGTSENSYTSPEK
ncbi:MAG: esterase/lipase family protein, partial [Bacteriovorax sp.]